MTTTQPATMRRIEPPVTPATDAIRLSFHSLTGMVLPGTLCQACWLNIVALSIGTMHRAEILEVDHHCPHSVEPDLVLFHALEGLPEEDYWAMPDPWSEAM